jgi:hypothetical protein
VWQVFSWFSTCCCGVTFPVAFGLYTSLNASQVCPVVWTFPWPPVRCLQSRRAGVNCLARFFLLDAWLSDPLQIHPEDYKGVRTWARGFASQLAFVDAMSMVSFFFVSGSVLWYTLLGVCDWFSNLVIVATATLSWVVIVPTWLLIYCRHAVVQALLAEVPDQGRGGTVEMT